MQAESRTKPTTEPRPVSLLITQDRIQLYAELSGDYNPLHVDPEFGRRSPFGSTIAHGPIAAALAFQVVGDWLQTLWPQCEFQFTFTSPVRAGDTITARASAGERKPEESNKVQVLDLRLENQRGELVITGQALIHTGHLGG